jgi:hypothetical protein
LHDPSSKKEDVEEEPVDLPTGKRFVVYVGTLEPYRNHLLIGAFREVVRRFGCFFTGGRRHGGTGKTL